ncbi:MAG: hypothetical protein FJ387_09705 [Verrucomicrobia bacterium]|nr:hypothetical protein [Verrucomicrobiota bacterium]
MRKRILKPNPNAPAPVAGELDVAALATVLVTSERIDHPVENAFDASRGPGGSRWVADSPGEQTLILAFDQPQTIRQVLLEVEETQTERTQQVELAYSTDGGRSYRELARQEYNFAPPGTTFERERWELSVVGATHLRLVILPDKGSRPCQASLTAMALR